ncbi:MAG: protein kinase domain-containing protein, partial [Pseudobdellovibrionaceae bacterium]
CLKIARSLTLALIEIHRAGFVHRDIKPSNVMLTKNNNLKLIDFGLVTRAQDSFESNGTIVGTIRYTSPEQLGLIKQAVDGRSDLYSLGMLLYHCLAGRPAFLENDIGRLLEHHLKTTPDPVRSLNPAVSPILSDIIAKLIAKNPSDRYDSAAQLLHDFENISTLRQLGSRRASLQNQVLVGREEEVSFLKTKWQQAKAGNGNICYVMGESGYGKTRLCDEIMNLAERENATIIRGKNEERNSHPLGALREAVQSQLDLALSTGGEFLETEKNLIRQSLVDLPSAVFQFSSKLKDFADPSTSKVSDANGSDEQIAMAMSEFMTRFIGKRGKPVVLLLDDAQWFSPVGLVVLEKITVSISNLPVLLLITARSEAEASYSIAESLGTAQKKIFSLIELKALRPEKMSQIIQDKLGGRQPPPQIVKHVCDLAKGSPYMVDQLMRTLIDSNVLSLSNRNWTVDLKKLASLPLADNLIDVIVARLQLVEEDTRDLLKAASVLGIQFSHSILTRMLNWSEIRTSNTLQKSVKAGLIEHIEGDSFRFIHDKVLESLQVSATELELRQLHQKAALTFDHEQDSNLFAAAYHFTKSDFPEDSEKAFHVTFRAGAEALNSNSGEHAIQLLKFTLQKAHFLSKPKQTLGEIEFLLGKASRQTGMQAESEQYFKEALKKTKGSLTAVKVRTEIFRSLFMVEMKFDSVENELIEAFEGLSRPLPLSKPALILDTIFYLVLMLIYKLFFKRVTKPEAVDYYKTSASLARLAAFYFNYTDEKLRFINLLPRLGVDSARLGPCSESVHILGSYAIVFSLARKKWLTEKSGQAAIKMAKDLHDSVAMARAGIDYALAHSFLGLPLLSQKLTKDLRAELDSWILPEDFSRMTSDIALNQVMRGRIRETLATTAEALDKCAKYKIETRKTLPTVAICAAHSISGNTEAALEARNTVFDLIRNNPNFMQHPHGVPMFIYGILTYHYERDELDECSEFIKTSEIYRYHRAGSPFQRSMFQAIAYVRIRQFELKPTAENENELKTALADMKKVSFDSPFLCQLYVLQARYARLKGQLKVAEKLLPKAQKHAQLCDGQLCLFEVLLEQARIKKLTGESIESRSYALHAHEISQKMGWSTRQSKVLKEFELSESKSHSSATVNATSMLTPNRYSKALMDLSLAMTGVITTEEQTRLALDEAVKLLRAERGFFFFLDANEKPELSLGRTQRGETVTSDAGYSQTIINQVHQTQEPVIMVADGNNVYASIESIVARNLKSIIAAPMFLRSKYVGIAYFDSDVVKGLFSKDDLDVCRGLGSHFIVAQEISKAASLESEKAILKKDLELTAAVQSLLFPSTNNISVPNLDVSAFCKPATICGGDWWWWSKMPDGTVRALLIDVTGHGAAPAMVTAIIATAVRQKLDSKENLSFPEILDFTNTILHSIIQQQYMATVSAVELNPQTGLLKWWAGAAPFFVIVDKDRQLRSYEEPGDLLGMKESDFKLGYLECQLAPGDRVYIFSDGL